MVRKLFVLLGMAFLLHAVSAGAAPCAGFTVVDAADPFCDEVTWMKNRGITLGLTATTYGPNNPVSRLQMALFMYRLGFENAFLQGGNAFGAAGRLGTTDDETLELVASNVRALRIEPHPTSPNLIAGFVNNGAYAGVYGTHIGGGGASGTSYEGATCQFAFGCQNSATDHFGTIGGGAGNLVGETNGDLTDRQFGTVGGGFSNAASDYGTVGGGRFNQATGTFGTVPGGESNRASGAWSTAFGYSSQATHLYSVAIGTLARAGTYGCIVFADASTFNPTSCVAPNQFLARALGGVYFFTGGTSDATYTGAYLGPGTSAWAPYSDRDGKDEISAVDANEVLRKVVAMPVSTWRWKAEPGAIRHMGPMAQDFYAAFGLGTSDKRIVTIDADGVALAAI